MRRITGQTREMVEHYAQAVSQKRLAASAILKWEAAPEGGASNDDTACSSATGANLPSTEQGKGQECRRTTRLGRCCASSYSFFATLNGCSTERYKNTP